MTPGHMTVDKTSHMTVDETDLMTGDATGHMTESRDSEVLHLSNVEEVDLSSDSRSSVEDQEDSEATRLSIEISHVDWPTGSQDDVFDPPSPAGLRAHPPLQKLQSDSAVPSSRSTVIKRKACVVKLDGYKYTIGELLWW